MFQCIACSKQAVEEDEQGRERGTPRTKGAVKSLTAQLKDMALRFSGAYNKSKSGAGSSTYRRGLEPYPEDDTSSSEEVEYPYMEGVGSGSTPAWEFRPNFPRGRSDTISIGGISGGDRTPRGHGSVAARDAVVLVEENEPREWVAEVEPGIEITFKTLPSGGNDLRRVRFDREMFDRWHAQVWWGENFDRIMELYNIKRFNRQAFSATPARSEDELRGSYSRQPYSGGDSPVAAWLNNDATSRNRYMQPSGITMEQGSSSHQYLHAAGSSMEASRVTSRDDPSSSNSTEIEAEWIEQDAPGVFVTIRQLPDGSKELRRVRFSRQRFGDEDAKKWWEENRDRIHAQYL